MRVPFDDVHDTLRRELLTAGMAPDRADLSARLFAETSRDGVHSHGLNRLREGVVVDPAIWAAVKSGSYE